MKEGEGEGEGRVGAGTVGLYQVLSIRRNRQQLLSNNIF